MQLAKKSIYGKANLTNVKKKYETEKKREFTNLKNHIGRQGSALLCCDLLTFLIFSHSTVNALWGLSSFVLLFYKQIISTSLISRFIFLFRCTALSWRRTPLLLEKPE